MTTTWRPFWEPGAIWVIPVPITIEQAEPGCELHETQLIGDLEIVVEVESDLVDVERLGAVDIGDGNGYELELHVHRLTLAMCARN